MSFRKYNKFKEFLKKKYHKLFSNSILLPSVSLYFPDMLKIIFRYVKNTNYPTCSWELMAPTGLLDKINYTKSFDLKLGIMFRLHNILKTIILIP